MQKQVTEALQVIIQFITLQTTTKTFLQFSVICGRFVRLFIEDLFGDLWSTRAV